MSGVSISVEERTEIIVDYTHAEDLEAEMLRPGEDHSGDPSEAGWLFKIRGRRVVEVGSRQVEAGEWSTLAEGGVPADLPVAAAVTVSVIIDNFPEGTAEIAVHSIDGSAEKFDEAFQGAFDLAVGAPELLPEDIQEDHR